MARQPYFVNTSDKQMEVFSAFDGGMNTQEHPSKLSDNEFTLMENVDIVAGGVVTNRGAYKRTNDPTIPVYGISQGIFFYENTGSGVTIHAVGGFLYKVEGNVYTRLIIVNLEQGFQDTRQIEAVQYRNIMYIATGSGIVIFDGTTATLLTAYMPTGLEALYIGTNGYAADPDNYLADTTSGSSNDILGIKSDQRYGIAMKNVTFTAYVSKVPSDTLEYKFSSKYVTEPKFTDWTGGWSTSKTKSHKFGKNTDYQIRCEIRKQGTTVVLDEYIIPKFRVASTPDTKPEATINFDDMKLCNRILIHYDRLVLYGDTNNPDHMYTSHLNNFRYFPRTNILRITDPLRGILRNVVQYKNFLVAFTDNTIVMITGVAPVEYAKIPIHTTLGSNKPYSIQVIKNHLVFVGNDNAVYLLKSFNYSTTDKLNVERIDSDIRDSLGARLKTASKVLTAIYEDQYYMYIESTLTGNAIYRFYYEMGVWVRDATEVKCSNMKNIKGVLTLGNDLFGRIYKLVKGVYVDGVDTKFDMVISSKDYDYNMPYHKKKLKQFQMVAKVKSDTTIMVNLVADDTTTLLNAPIVVDPTKNSTDSQKFILSANGRFRYIQSTFTIQVKSDIYLIGFGFVFKYSSPK